jgi:carbon monoxide dehydrogenase subunit G
MTIAGKITVQAPIKRVWDMLLEPETLQACLPGIEKVERLDEKSYALVIAQRVGPMTVRFRLEAALTKIEAPHHLEIEGRQAAIGKAERRVHNVRIDLREITGNSVEISYETDVNRGGALGIWGEKILQARVEKMEAAFASALQKRLDSRA